MTDFEWFASIADEKLRVTANSPLEYAKRGELADEGIDDDFKNVRKHVLLRIRLGMDFNRTLAFAGIKLRRIALCWIRHQTSEYVEQFGHAGPVAR